MMMEYGKKLALNGFNWVLNEKLKLISIIVGKLFLCVRVHLGGFSVDYGKHQFYLELFWCAKFIKFQKFETQLKKLTNQPKTPSKTIKTFFTIHIFHNNFLNFSKKRKHLKFYEDNFHYALSIFFHFLFLFEKLLQNIYISLFLWGFQEDSEGLWIAFIWCSSLMRTLL